MLSAMITAIGEAITKFSSALVSGLSALVEAFYDTTNSELTAVGTLVMIALGIGIVYWLFGWVRQLVHLRG